MNKINKSAYGIFEAAIKLIYTRFFYFSFACFLFILLFSFDGYSQNKYIVYFKDKGTKKNYDTPEKLLSSKAIERRNQQGILMDDDDMPVNVQYLNELSSAGCKLLSTSKWLNSTSITTVLSPQELQQRFVFIKQIVSVKDTSVKYESSPKYLEQKTNLNYSKIASTIDYGQANTQNTMLGIECLHKDGYTGKNTTIAVIDGGFLGADTMRAFDSLRIQKRIIGAFDFVANDSFPYRMDEHGAGVLSVITANLPGQMVGIAPHAKFLLARTITFGNYDIHADEYLWIRAMEWADSSGADIISTSLGWSNYYGGGDTNYTYANMDGRTTIVTKGASIASRKGIIVVASAGNQGNKSWHYISAPCDGDSVLCVGAVDYTKTHSYFSSYGPSYDGRIKPDVMAMGQSVKVVWPGTSGVTSMNGTSFSAPLIAGLTACLKQKHPGSTNMEVINAIIQSADRYSNPDFTYGNGIPNACTADSLLTNINEIKNNSTLNFQLYPNPAHNELQYEIGSIEKTTLQIRIINILGQIVINETKNIDKGISNHTLNISELSSGSYVLQIITDSGTDTRQKQFLIK
ncbi:MAG: S8 family peptidase [Bacteroidetes bacterium]|nr:S8 family peptidase [Bacteroidota bacterium]